VPYSFEPSSTASTISWTPEESRVESCEHQDDANIRCQPFPESVSEEHEIYSGYDGRHRHHVKYNRNPSAHVSLFIPPAEFGLVLVAFDRATLPWHAGQVIRSSESHGGLILFRRTVRSTNFGEQARLLTEFRADEGHARDWLNHFVYLPRSP
jgi:hypothetical protein